MSKKLSIAIEPQNGVSIIQFDGIIDASNIDEVRRYLDSFMEQAPPQLALDCRDLRYINSTAFGMLFKYHRSCEAKGGCFLVFGVQKKIMNIMRILGLDHVLNLYPTLDEALQSCNDQENP